MSQQMDAWLLTHLPGPLQQLGPYQLAWWQWLALCLLVLVAWGLATPLSHLSRGLLTRIARRTATSWDDKFFSNLRGPLRLVWTTVLCLAGLPWLRLSDAARGSLLSVLRVAALAAFFWALLRAVDVARRHWTESAWGHPATRSLLPIAGRLGELFVVVLAVLTLLSELGYQVTSLVAGLGIGGVAVALGAQKTLENLFGALAIGTDQPFLQGDTVRVGDLVGTVEAIGLRSTRIRTPDRTLVTIPNGKLADMQIESLAARDRLRLSCLLTLDYGTRPGQLRAVLSGLERVLREHPKLWPDTVIVRFAGFGESSLNVEVAAWFLTSDWNEFLAIREDTLLRFMEVVEREGSSFAFPTRTVHMVAPHEAPSLPATPSA
ncbi:MAG TPA: mechanosensitive ion channel family protein [Polyangiaceae bacterium]|nr:mechanosensitive ion channel family protein [Polyangiaceae bacterium]